MREVNLVFPSYRHIAAAGIEEARDGWSFYHVAGEIDIPARGPNFRPSPFFFLRMALTMQRIGMQIAITVTCLAGLAPAPPKLIPQPLPASLETLDFRMSRLPIAVMPGDGSVILVDDDESQLVRVNLHTGAMTRFGKQGSGPREFPDITDVGVDPDGRVIALSTGRMTILSRDLTFVSSFPMTRSVGEIGRITRDSIYILGDSFDSVYAFSMRSGAFRSTAGFGGQVQAVFHGPAPYQRGFWITARPDGGWYLASPYAPTILIADHAGRVVSRIDRSPAREYPSASELREVRATMTRANPGMNLDRFMKTFAATPSPFVRSAPCLDSQGRLWVPTRRIRHDSTEVDVYSPSGASLGTVRISGILQRLTVRGSDVVAIIESLDDASVGDIGLRYFRIP